MEKNITKLQYNRLCILYRKLNQRLSVNFALGRFAQMSKNKQLILITRLEKLKRKLLQLEHHLKLSGLALTLGIALYANSANAQVAAIGAEFKVNNYITLGQHLPSVAMEDDGNFIISWQSNGQDGSGNGVYAQQYSANGLAQGSQFRVNTYTTNGQLYPSVAIDNNGNFVIAWISDGQDGSSHGIYAQRYSATGIPLGLEFQVNTYTTNSQYAPSLAMDADGDFVITWHSDGQDGSSNGIYAQQYNAAGLPQGTEFKVNTTAFSLQFNPEIVMDADGDFLITWISDVQDGSSYGIYAQRYNALGVAQGVEFRANTYTTGKQTQPSADMDDNGNFVISWQSITQDGSGEGVYAQRYNSSGVAQGVEFLVNTYTTNNQEYATVAMDSNGDFIIAWASGLGQDGSFSGVYAQRYSASGALQGAEFRVNTYTTSGQLFADATMNNSGDFVIAWQSRDQDGDNYGIYAQRYGLPIANEPAVASINPVSGSISTSSITLNWTNGDGSNRVVLIKEGSPVDAQPMDGSFYNANAVFGSGSEVGTGNYSVYVGSGNNITITGLVPGTIYYYEIFEVNGTGNKSNYLTSSSAQGSQSSNSVSTLTTNGSVSYKILVYPNPAKDKLFIEQKGVLKLRVFNSIGKELLVATISDNGSIAIDNLVAGAYILELHKDDSISRRVIVIE